MILNEIYKPVQDGLKEVEKTLKSVSDVKTPLLAELLSYLLQNGGKRIRPALTLLAGKFQDYNVEILKPMAAGLEMLHIATLVHDDIVDHSATRHGKPSVSSAWGETSALLLGDYLFARAGHLVAGTGVLRVVRLFSQTLMTISSGELAQIGIFFDRKKARQHYFEWVSAKTACLFSTATESGAVLGNCSEDTITALQAYGPTSVSPFRSLMTYWTLPVRKQNWVSL
jgi:geranylgeranyl pyrophosphate synthase